MSGYHYKQCVITAMAVITLAGRGQSQEKWASDMELSTYEGGGRVPQSKTIVIKNKSCMYIHWRQPKKDTLYFILSKQELNTLLKEINTTHFKKIISEKRGSVIHDKSTTSVQFDWSGKTHKVSVGATEEIKKGDAEGFYTLYDYILSLAVKKTGQEPE